MKKELKNTDKVMISSRVPVYVKEFCETNNVKINDLIMRGFDVFRESDRDHAHSRLEYHEKRVLHWRHIVLQQDEECNTKWHICNTIKKEFVENNRGSKESYRMDMNWITAKTEQLINEGIIVSSKELYELCTRKEEKI